MHRLTLSEVFFHRPETFHEFGTSLTGTNSHRDSEQVATVMVATARIAAEHGSFNRICQVAPHVPQSRT